MSRLTLGKVTQNYIDPSGYEGEDGGYAIPVYGWIKFFSRHKHHKPPPPRQGYIHFLTMPPPRVVNSGGQVPNVDVYIVDPRNAGLGIQLAQASPGGTLSDATPDWWKGCWWIVCTVQASEDGEKPPWMPPWIPGGVGRIPGAAGPEGPPPNLGKIEWRPPNPKQIEGWKRILKESSFRQ